MPRPIHPLAQYLMALAIMIGAYSAYAKFAVPIIEGPRDQVRRRIVTAPSALPEKQDNKARLFKLLPNNAWELDRCKTLFTNSGTLLFQEMTRVDDEGTYTLTPFTMIMNDHESGTAFAAKLDPSVPPTVLRCGEAILKFDGPLALTGKSKTKMRSANLTGEVTIFRPSASPEKDETLKLITQNVQINTQQILTFSEVAFAFGPHKGSGKNLSIDLVHYDQGDQNIQQDFSSISGVSRIELVKLDRLLLDPRAIANGAGPDHTAGNHRPVVLNAAKAPLEVTCSGPFVFDYDNRTATFEEKVYGKQLDAFGDNLSCETLTVGFAKPVPQTSPDQLASGDSASGQSAGGLNIQYLNAVGTPAQPAVIIANSRRTKITGDQLQFDSVTNEIIASSAGTTTIVGPEINIRAKTLKYELTDDQSLGNLQAVGPGEFFRRSDDRQQNLFARWQRELIIDDHDDNQKMIVLDGGAEILAQEETQIASDRINIVLVERKKQDGFEYLPSEISTEQRVAILSPNLDGVAGKLMARWSQPESSPEAQPSTAPRPEFSIRATAVRPHQVMRPQFPQAIIDQLNPAVAADDPPPSSPIQPTAAIENSQPQTKLQRLSPSSARPNFAPLRLAAFESDDPVTSAATPLRPGGPRNLSDSQPGNSPSSTSENRSLKSFIRFKTDSVSLELTQTSGQTQLTDLQMDGNVVIHQLPQRGSAKPPLKVAGDRVRVVPQGEKIFRLLVSGTKAALATVDSQALVLSGEAIHLDQQSNKVWVSGEGVMHVKQSPGGNDSKFKTASSTAAQSVANRGAEGRPESSSDLAPRGDIDVEFAGGMVFDGEKIYFERNVMMTSSGDPEDPQRSITKTLSQALSIELGSRVDFSQLSSGQKIGDVKMNEMVLVNRITDDQRVFKNHVGNDDPRMNAADTPIIFQNETFDPSGQLTQQRRVIVPSATINAVTNTVYAVGPGKIFAHQKGGGGLTDIGGLNQLGTSPQTPQGSSDESQINYLQVNFDDRLVADLGQKQLNITGNIRTLFSPADGFDFSLDPDQAQQLPAGAIKMLCENMQLSQWLPAGADKPQNEIIATGNTHVISPTVEATSDRISYNDANDQMVVEGTPRSPANLWHRQTPRGQRQHLMANKIIYHPSTGTAQTQGVRNLNVSIGK